MKWKAIYLDYSFSDSHGSLSSVLKLNWTVFHRKSNWEVLRTKQVSSVVLCWFSSRRSNPDKYKYRGQTNDRSIERSKFFIGIFYLPLSSIQVHHSAFPFSCISLDYRARIFLYEFKKIQGLRVNRLCWTLERISHRSFFIFSIKII